MSSINMSPYCKYGNLSQHDGSDSADLGTALGYVGYRIREDRCNSGDPEIGKKVTEKKEKRKRREGQKKKNNVSESTFFLSP